MKPASLSVCVLLLLALLFASPEQHGVQAARLSSLRRLLAVGDVSSDTKIYLDPNGGLTPFPQRLATVIDDVAARQELIVLNSQCAAGDQAACKEYQVRIDAEAKAATRGKKRTEPCYQNIFLSILLGTYCDLPPGANLGK